MDPSPKKETEMNAKTMKSALAAALTCLSSAALAVIQTLPMPPPSPYPDAESSVAVPLDASCGPLMRLRIAADFTPSNAVIVAFGTDVDNDGDLSLEETAIRVGVDCGASFIREESKSKVEVEQRRFEFHCSTSDFDFSLPTRVSLEHGVSSVSHGLTASNSYLFAWHDCCVERCATNRVDASVELFDSGAIATTVTPLSTNQPPITIYQPPIPPEGFVGIGQGGGKGQDY